MHKGSGIPRARRRARPGWWRLALVCLLTLGIGGGSAVFTAAIARTPRGPATDVAWASNPPLLAGFNPDDALAPFSLRDHAPGPDPGALVAHCLGVPILVYHYIRVNPVPTDRVGWNLSVTPAEFQAQMDWLHAVGAHAVSPAQVVAALSGGQALPARAVVLTFDDGYDDFATAAEPVLSRDGFVATDYVVSGFIGRPGYMTAADVKQAAASGFVIGAHTVNHVNLTALPTAAAAAEIQVSKAVLEQLLGKPVLDFAYPYGGVSPSVAALVAEAGFRDAMTMDAGSVQCAGAALWLHRVRIGGSDTVWSFAAKADIPTPPTYWVDPVRAVQAPVTPTAVPPTATPSPSPSPSPRPSPSPTGSPTPVPTP